MIYIVSYDCFYVLHRINLYRVEEMKMEDEEVDTYLLLFCDVLKSKRELKHN